MKSNFTNRAKTTICMRRKCMSALYMEKRENLNPYDISLQKLILNGSNINATAKIIKHLEKYIG